MEAIAKMYHITTVQALQKSVYGVSETYDELNKVSIERLMELRDELLPAHNEIVEDRKFGADMIYKKSPEINNQKIGRALRHKKKNCKHCKNKGYLLLRCRCCGGTGINQEVRAFCQCCDGHGETKEPCECGRKY